MSERHQKCRFWPRCYIHMGEKPPRQFTTANHREWQELRREGWRIRDIAETFGASVGHVSHVVNEH